MTDSEFDAVLRRALTEVIREDYADILEGEPEVPPFTKRHLRWRRNLLADPTGYVGRLARPVWRKALRTAACILLALATLFGAVMAVSPSARAWVVRMYTEWREDHMNFIYPASEEESSELSDWRPCYIPEGYTEDTIINTDNLIRLTFKNTQNQKLYFSYRSLRHGGMFSVDNEHAEAEYITINNNVATIINSSNISYRSHLSWIDEDEDTAFLLSGYLDKQVLIEVAKSVEKFP